MKEKLDRLNELSKISVSTTIGKIILSFSLVSLAFFLIGWMLFGWVIAPVKWVYPEPPPGMNGLAYQSKATYALVVSEWYAYSRNDQKLYFFSSQFSDFDTVACQLAAESVDMAQAARLIKVAYLTNGYGCNQVNQN